MQINCAIELGQEDGTGVQPDMTIVGCCFDSETELLQAIFRDKRIQKDFNAKPTFLKNVLLLVFWLLVPTSHTDSLRVFIKCSPLYQFKLDSGSYSILLYKIRNKIPFAIEAKTASATKRLC